VLRPATGGPSSGSRGAARVPRCRFKVDVRPLFGLTNVNAVPDAAPHFGVCSQKAHPDAVPEQAPARSRPQDSANRLPRPWRAAPGTTRDQYG